MNYIEFELKIKPTEPWSDILTAELAELGCDSFIQTAEGVNAYAPQQTIELQDVQELVKRYNEEADCEIQVDIHFIEEQNWNATWEADFEPVFVEDKLVILAPFHQLDTGKAMTIVIEPKMSFGTGHHQTTWMMAKSLLDKEKMPQTILDMGSGTGFLAILAEKLGAQQVLAVDIEEWAYENAIDNASRNGCQHVEVRLGGVEQIKGYKADLILANINKNVLKAQMEDYAKIVHDGGELIISGFFDSDRDEMIEVAAAHGFIYRSHLNKDNWCCIALEKKN
jgi:ribosomal protein L11 methyltransferase